MAKFETTGQIVTLFLGAACVGVLLIVLLTAEASKRQAALDRSDEIVVTETEDISELTGIKYIWNKMKSSVRYITHPDETPETERKNRRKREVSPDYYSNHVIEGEYDDVVENLDIENTSEHQPMLTEKPSLSKKSHSSMPSDLGSALLSTALSGHKIRHIEEKISMLGEDSQLVQAVLDMFCTKDETVLYVICMQTGNSTEKSTDTTEEDTDHLDNVNNTNGTVARNPTAEHSKNYTESLHSYVNVMRNRLAPEAQASNAIHSSGICSSFTEFIVVVILTSFANFFIFVLISLYCRISKKVIDRNMTESDENLISEEDELEVREKAEEKKWNRNSGNLHVNLCHQIGFNDEFEKI